MAKMAEADCSLWYKRLRLALDLDRNDVVEVMRLGGVEISKSRADAWARGRPAADERGVRQTMTASEFDAFTRGLVEWSKR